MAFPIKIYVDPNAVTLPIVRLLFKASDVIFKYVGWCLVLGVAQYGLDKTHDWRLGILVAILYLLLFLPYCLLLRWALTAIRVEVTWFSSRADAVIRIAIPVIFVFAVTYVGLNVIEFTISMISQLGAHKQ